MAAVEEGLATLSEQVAGLAEEGGPDALSSLAQAVSGMNSELADLRLLPAKCRALRERVRALTALCWCNAAAWVLAAVLKGAWVLGLIP